MSLRSFGKYIGITINFLIIFYLMFNVANNIIWDKYSKVCIGTVYNTNLIKNCGKKGGVSCTYKCEVDVLGSGFSGKDSLILGIGNNDESEGMGKLCNLYKDQSLNGVCYNGIYKHYNENYNLGYILGIVLISFWTYKLGKK